VAILSLHLSADIRSTSSFMISSSGIIKPDASISISRYTNCAPRLLQNGRFSSKLLSLPSDDAFDQYGENEINKKSFSNFDNEGDGVRFSDLGEYDPSRRLGTRKDIFEREVLVGDPQMKVKKKDKSVATILQELAAIQKQGPKKYCILGSRHCSYLHQQIIELLSYALVLSENHVYTSGAGGTNAAAIKGALRAERPDLLTVILPQSLELQSRDSQELMQNVTDLITMPQNDNLSLDVASKLCNSRLLSESDQLIAFAFHESQTVIEATKEAKELEMLVTTLFLD